MRRTGKLFAAAGVVLAGAPAGAQELTQRFVNPGFGGNPFNSDYLIGTATAQRPERRSDSSTTELTETQLFARQIQSRLLSSLSSSLVEAITGAAPGTSGEFVVGDQTIAFERTLREIRLTIRDNGSGQVTTIAVPVLNLNNAGTTGTTGAASGASSNKAADSLVAGALGSNGTLSSGSVAGGASSIDSPIKTGL